MHCCQREMASGHSGPAHDTPTLPFTLLPRALDSACKLCGRPESSCGGQVTGKRQIDRTRDMTSNTVNRFCLAAKSCSIAHIEQCHVAIGCRRGLDVGRRDDHVSTCPGDEMRCRPGYRPALQRVSVVLPGLDAAIEKANPAVPEPVHHPPRASGDRTVCGVINHNLGVVADTPLPEALRYLARVGQRVSTAACSYGAGQILVKIRVDGTRDVPVEPGLAPGGGLQQVESAIDDAQVLAAETVSQLRGRDER